MSFSLFKGYTEHGARGLLEQGEIRALSDNEILFNEGDAPNAVFLVLSGGLDVFVERQGRPISVNTILPGKLVGELGWLCEHPRSASVRAHEVSTLVRWKNSAFHGLMLQDFTLFRRVFADALGLLIEREKALVNQVIQGQQGGH